MIWIRSSVSRQHRRVQFNAIRLLVALVLCAAGALLSMMSFAAQATLKRPGVAMQQSTAPCVVLPVPYRCETWVSTYAGSGNGAGIAVGIAPQNSQVIATSPDGKMVYVAGTSVNSDNNTTSYVVLAFDAATGTQRWASQYPEITGSTNASSYALAVSPDGSSVFVTGTITGGIATAALAADTGNQLWVSTYPNSYAIAPPDITTDGQRVYISAAAYYKDIDGSTYAKAVAIAYDAATGTQLWLAHDVGNPGATSFGSKIAVSRNGSYVYMAGGKSGSSGYVVDVLLFTYDATTGNTLQETHHGPTQGFPPAGIVVSPNGSRVFVEEANVETTLNNALTLAYDGLGNSLWTARYPTSCADANCATRPWYYDPIITSPDGSTVFVTGTYLHVFGEQAFVTIAYDAATGTEKWEAMYPHNVVDNIVGPVIATNPNGKEIYVSGPANNSNITTLAYDASNGNQNWIAVHGVGSPQGIAVSPDGSQVFVAGGIVTAQTQPAGMQTEIIALAYRTTSPPLTPAPVLTGVVSHKAHGGAGAFDIDLPDIGQSGIECRSGGPTNDYTMIFTFSQNLVAVGGASVTSGTGSVTSSAIGPNPNQYSVNLTGVTNAQYISVTLTGVVDSAGDVGDFSDTMGVLLGDVNASGRVDAADVSAVRQQTLQAIDSTNFRDDVNTSSRIDAADVSVVRQQTLTSLP